MGKAWPKICSTLIDLMDSGRENWFSILIGWFKEYAVIDIVNADFKSDTSIGMKEENIPEGFPFNSISGENIEIALMTWQLQMAIDFALEQDYMVKDELQDFFRILFQCERWACAGVISRPLAIGDIAQALAHYTMNDTLNSEPVISVAKELESHGATLLVGFTELAVATAFGDEITMHRIRERLKPE